MRFLTVLVAAGLLSAWAGDLPIHLHISTERFPAVFATEQVRVYLDTPQAIASGMLSFNITLDYAPAYEDLLTATVFSATGDVAAVAHMSYNQLQIVFDSPSAGVGRLPGVPLMLFSFTSTFADVVALDTQQSRLIGPAGTFEPTVTGLSVLSSTLSINAVQPAGSTGILPAGTAVAIQGTGFAQNASVKIDGASVLSSSVVSPRLVNVTLAGSTELAGKRIVVRNPNGFTAETWAGLDTGVYTFPFSATSSASCGLTEPPPGEQATLAMLNSNPASAQLDIDPAVPVWVAIPSGGVYVVSSANSTISSDPSTPIRTICYDTLQLSDDQFAVLNVEPQIASNPTVGSIVNAASMVQSGISPGEIVTIFGTHLGPSEPVGLTLDSYGSVARESGGVRVSFDGIPAPVLYASESQLNVVVPYEIYSNQVTQVEVELNGVASAAWGVPVTAAAPGVFTVAQQAGSVVIYGTGEGLTVPVGITGAIINGDDVRTPLLPVSVTIGGENAAVQYAGSAQGFVAGLFQVNAEIPEDLKSGSTVSVVLTVGSSQSRTMTLTLK